MEREQKFKVIIELFKGSFLKSLDKEDSEDLLDILKDERLARVHEKMLNGELINDGFLNQFRFSSRKAFRDFENRTKHQKNGRFVLFRRLTSIAAVLLVGLTVAFWYAITSGQVEEREPVIAPGNNKAHIQLANGDIISLAANSLHVEEEGGASIKYENGGVAYTASVVNEPEVAFNELVVPRGGECHIVFEDGTRVWLNSGTTLRYPTRFIDAERKIYLDGEAYFEVTPGDKPFIVHSSLGEVKVLGTSFGVRAYPDENMATTLVTGKVAFHGADTVVLFPGEQVVAYVDGQTERRVVDVEEYVGWKRGVYVFNKRSLEMIMKDFERWYDISVVFVDPGLKDMLFSGDIDRYDSINTFMELLKNTEDIRYRIIDKRIELFR